MSDTMYMFIDGAFLRAQIISAQEVYELDENVDIDYSELLRGVSRAFFYDSYPSKKPQESEKEHHNEIFKTEVLFKKIGSTPNLHVKTGLSRYQKRKRGAEQKAVDILLAMDMYRHAIHGNMDTAIIVTSDLDFAPVLEALLETKVRSRLWFDPKKTSDLLIDAADVAEPFNELDIMRFVSREISQHYTVSLQAAPDDYFTQMPKVSDQSGADWQFTVFLDERHNRYIGHMEGGDGYWISSRDFRSVRLDAEGRYRINLEGLKIPKDVHLKEPR